jgi:preprotein translocase subunit SecD
MIVIPSLFGLPTMFFSVPPLVVLFPAMLTFGIQIATPGIGLGAVIAMLVDRSVQV